MTIMPAPSVSQQPRAIPNQQRSAPSASATDPAALREAALKSRRRKLGSGSEPAGIPPRPQTVHVTTAEPSIQLDYGQEDPSGASPTTSSASTVAPPTKSTTPEPKEDDDQSREEGEISDSEPPSASPVVKPKVVSQAKPQSAPTNVSKPSTSAQTPPIPASAPTTLKTSTSTAPTQSASVSMPPPPIPLPYRLDENHVRPGLEMTQAQYDTAKDIVLDLLGWGVPPDYLVSCGVSREIMFYVFTELNLRLPSNFDATGIPPYPPVPTDFNATPTTGVTTRLDSMTLHPENGVAKANGHGSHGQTILSPTAATFLPSTALSSSAGPNLYDMEQQRRQELLARKAAIASRKKQVAPVATSAAKEPKDVEAVDTVPTKTVEDFLKSIGPTTEDTSKGKAPVRQSSAPSRSIIEDAMDVDEVIPGLSIDTMMSAASPLPEPAPTARTPTPVTSTPISATRPQSAADSVANRSPQSISSSSGEGSPVNTSPSEAEVVPGLAFNIAAHVPEASRRAPPVRRGTKRPVAADFDDDARPHTSRPPPAYTNGNPYHQPSYKRNVGSFAGLSGMRRCVIDLSDSEEEEEEEGAIPTASRRHIGNGTSRPSSGARVGPLSGSSISRQSPPNYDSATPTGALTPAVLQEKEEEIRKMRELIKQREQSRLRKLATAFRSTPPTVDTPANGGLSACAHCEEDPSASASDGHHSGSNTPIPLASIPSTSSTTISIPPTPIDIVANSFLDTATGERVLTAEANREKPVGTADGMSSGDAMNVDVVSTDAETSAQNDDATTTANAPQRVAQDDDASTGFSAYSSPLACFPLLRTRSYLDGFGEGSSGAQADGGVDDTSSISSSPRNTAIDLRDLKTAHTKNLLTDPSRPICQYEVPGGGECRDTECECIHLSRPATAEPSGTPRAPRPRMLTPMPPPRSRADEETAHYLYARFAAPARSGAGVKEIKDALVSIRARSPAKAFDHRVAEVVGALGLR